MKSFVSSLISVLFLSSVAIAHGEDKLGPNGGYIRMPGAFHTEIVPQGQNQIRVYLLDIHWKNPSIRSSSVKAKLTGKSSSEAQCKVQDHFYLCTFDKKVSLQHGQLTIEAKRENQIGNPAVYDLPLSLNPIKSHNDEHSNH